MQYFGQSIESMIKESIESDKIRKRLDQETQLKRIEEKLDRLPDEVRATILEDR